MSTLKVNAINSTAASSGGLAIDTAGNVTGLGMDLITPTSIAYSGGTASATGGAVSFSGVSSISLNGVFSSTYANYRILIEQMISSTTPGILARLRASGSDNTTTNYNVQRVLFGSTTVTAGRDASGTYALIGDASTSTGAIIFDLINPALAANTVFQSTATDSTGTGINMRLAVSGFNATTSFDGITVYPNSGSLSGLLRVYGYKN